MSNDIYNPDIQAGALGDRAEIQAKQVKKQAYCVLRSIIREWKLAYNMLWTEGVNGVSAAQRLEALGPDAGELIRASGALVMFLNQELPGRNDQLLAEINEMIAKIPPYTVHPDGTVTLNA